LLLCGDTVIDLTVVSYEKRAGAWCLMGFHLYEMSVGDPCLLVFRYFFHLCSGGG
jgi:hypothetical protein